MKKIIAVALAAGFLFLGMIQAQNAPKPEPKKTPGSTNAKSAFKTEMEKVSYCYGLDFGEYLKRQSLDLDIDIFLKGLKDQLGGKKPAMTPEEIQMTMSAFQQRMQQKQREEYMKLQEKNRKDGAEFLEANKKKKGVITTASGLQYKILKDGTGRSPKPDEMIEVNYEGKLLDGTIFDSSYQRGQPALFMASRLIAGWKEALTMMKQGSEWEVYIPSTLAYGERGMPQSPIGPDATLIFKVQLVTIKSNMPPPPSMQQQPQR